MKSGRLATSTAASSHDSSTVCSLNNKDTSRLLRNKFDKVCRIASNRRIWVCTVFLFPRVSRRQGLLSNELGHDDFLLILKQDRRRSETSQEHHEAAQNSEFPLSGKRVVSLAVWRVL